MNAADRIVRAPSGWAFAYAVILRLQLDAWSAMPEHCYRFDDVELRPSARLLEVNGRSVNCPRLVFELLHLLCLHPGVLLRRDWLIEQLWPGGQVVADESLTQVLFKLRALLGPRGDAVVTVRGQGVRLDASVTLVEVAAAPEPLVDVPIAASEPAAPDRSPVPAAVSAASARRRLPVVAALLAIALLTVIAYALWPAPRVPEPPSLLDDPVIGIDLRPADLHASHEQTFAILRSALAADALGDRGRALALLRAAHDGDEQSPYPAIWLALLNTGGRAAPDAVEWLRLAEERAQGLNDALLSAYLALARNAVEDDRTANRGQLRALLDLRPRSWMLRQVLVRQLLVDGELETALLEARRMDYGQLGTRRLEDALGNRASLGDVDAAQKIFDAMTISRSDPGALSVAARLAYSAGNFELAEQRFTESNAAALAAGRRDLQVWNSIMLSLLTADRGDYEGALRMLETVVLLYHDIGGGEVHIPGEVVLLQAQWLALTGDADAAREKLLQAVQDSQTEEPDLLLMIELTGLRLTGQSLVSAPIQAQSRSQRGGTHLLEARLAWMAGDKPRADRALDAALALDLSPTAQYGEALLLAHDLGRPITVPERLLDPPLPLARWPAYFALRALPGPGAQSKQAGVPQP